MKILQLLPVMPGLFLPTHSIRKRHIIAPKTFFRWVTNKLKSSPEKHLALYHNRLPLANHFNYLNLHAVQGQRWIQFILMLQKAPAINGQDATGWKGFSGVIGTIMQAGFILTFYINYLMK